MGGRAEHRLGLVTLVHGRHGHLAGLLAGVVRGSRLPDHLVVVALGDAGVREVVAEAVRDVDLPWSLVDVDLPAGGDLPLAAGRNAGVVAAREAGCDRLVLLDVDCIPGPDLLARYDVALSGTLDADLPRRTGPRLWCGPVTYLPPLPEGQSSYDLASLAALGDPHPARPAPPAGQAWQAEDLRLFWSLSFGVTDTDWDDIGGFCEEYLGYGGEDTDFGETVHHRDGDLIWLGGADAYHQHHPTSSPPVQHLVAIVRNARLFASRWGWFPMQGWLEAFAGRGLVETDDAGRWCLTRRGEQVVGAGAESVPAP